MFLLYAKYLKRALDFALSILGIIVFSPVLLFAAIAIKLDTSGSIIMGDLLGSSG